MEGWVEDGAWIVPGWNGDHSTNELVPQFEARSLRKQEKQYYHYVETLLMKYMTYSNGLYRYEYIEMAAAALVRRVSHRRD
jgi:hypothetical protein